MEKDRGYEYRKNLPLDLLRQRRNLMLTCVVLLTLKITDGTFTKIPIFCGELSGVESNKLIVCIWAVCLYFLYRCYIYTRNENGWIATMRPLRDSVAEHINRVIAKEWSRRGCPDLKIEVSINSDGTFRNLLKIDASKDWKFYSAPPYVFSFSNHIKSVFFGYKTEFKYLDVSGGSLFNIGEVKKFSPIFFSYFSFKRLIVKIWFGEILRKKEFSDYLLPFFLFLVTVIEYLTGFLSLGLDWLMPTAYNFHNSILC